MTIQFLLLTFSVVGIIISAFAICFFAAGPSGRAVLRLKYALKSDFDTIFTEKNHDDKNTLDESAKTFDSNFEIFYLNFKFYCA